jgi:hypothetical protein
MRLSLPAAVAVLAAIGIALDTGSRQKTTRPGRGGGISNNVSRHRVENDVSIIQETVQSGTDGSGPFTSTTVFELGVWATACTGRSWPIASVTAINESWLRVFRPAVRRT